jgi:hypothetical protein
LAAASACRANNLMINSERRRETGVTRSLPAVRGARQATGK